MTGPSGGLAVHRVAAGALADRTVSLVGDALTGGVATTEVAVLARVNSALLPVQVALTEAGVAHTAPLDASVLGRTGVRTALAYLRLGLDLDRIRRDDVLDTLNRPARKVKSVVTPLLPRGQVSIRQLEQLLPSLGETHRDRFGDYLGDLRGLEQAITDGADTARCLWVVRNRIGLGEAMDALDASRTRPEGSSHGDDLDALEQLAALHPDPATFREWLTDRLRVPADPDGVTLSTVHRVKGMEWDRVVVFAANQGLFPHRLADDVEEERRVFHVAVTRCRERVDVVADRERTSTFVDELTRPAPARATDRDDVRAPAVVEVSPDADGTVAAEPGVAVTVAGGLAGTVVEVDGRVAVVHAPDLADADAPPLVLRIPFGEAVRVGGAPARFRAPGRPGRTSGRAGPPGVLALDGGDPSEAVDEALYEELRAWRSRVAAEHGVPAYLVFHDRHLRDLAARRPRTLRELAACPGVGPAKLDRYGDDVLRLVEGHPAS